MVKPKKHATADGEALRNSVNGTELSEYINRVESVNAEIADLVGDRREIFKEIKAAGYDPSTVRSIINRHAMNPEKLSTMDALLEQYMFALGEFADTPLGQAGADTLRDASA